MALRRFDKALIVLGVIAVVCIFGAFLAVIAAFSIIGIPIAIAMAAVPGIFTFLFVARMASIVMPVPPRWLTSAIVAAAILAAPAWFANKRIDADMAAQVAGDHNDMVQPFSPRVLAIRHDQFSYANRDETQCDDLCLRVLLNGVAERVIMAGYTLKAPQMDFGAKVRGFRLERRDICPKVEFPGGGFRPLDLEKGEYRNRPPRPHEVMRAEIASGNCLVDEPASLASADTILTTGQIKRGGTPYGAGFDIFADTISADRITVHARRGDEYVETFRETGVTGHRHWPLLLPTYVTGHELQITIGFQRRVARINIERQYEERPNLTGFVTQTLGLDLNVGDRTSPERTHELLSSLLARTGAIDPVVSSLAEDFFDTVSNRTEMTAQEAELGIAILRDERVVVPRGLWVLGRKSRHLDLETRRRIGQALFARLFAFPVDRSVKRSVVEPQFGKIGGAIEGLDDDVVRGHRAELERLARDQARRVGAYAALKRLAVFGEDVVPTLIYLLDDAEQFRKSKDSNDWQHPYLAGVGGICRAGAAGRAAIEPLFDRLARGHMAVHASYGRMLINTFAAISADAERTWQGMKAAGYKEERVRFDQTWERALNRVDCGY